MKDNTIHLLCNDANESWLWTAQQPSGRWPIMHAHRCDTHSSAWEIKIKNWNVAPEPCCLQLSTSPWHERFTVGVCRTGTHIVAQRARQPLSNYCKPARALLRHALNFAQDRWRPAEYAAESSFPTAYRCCLRIMSSLLLKRPASRLKMATRSQLVKFSFRSCVCSYSDCLCWMIKIRPKRRMA